MPPPRGRAGGSADLESGEGDDDGGPECVICMNPVKGAAGRLRGGLGGGVMVAPCGHAYHAACLRRWAEVKLECPTCRRPLPPL